MKHTVEQFLGTDCQLLKPFDMFMALHQATLGDPCTTGCSYFNGGKCEAYRKLTIPAKAEAQQEPMETVRETAARLGISISEVRRRRRSAQS